MDRYGVRLHSNTTVNYFLSNTTVIDFCIFNNRDEENIKNTKNVTASLNFKYNFIEHCNKNLDHIMKLNILDIDLTRNKYSSFFSFEKKSTDFKKFGIHPVNKIFESTIDVGKAGFRKYY